MPETDKKYQMLNQTFMTLLEAMDGEAVVVRGKACEILAANSAAAEHILKGDGKLTCADHYWVYPGLCGHCRARERDRALEGDRAADSGRFQTQNALGQTHEASVRLIEWADGKEARLLTLINVQAHIEAEKRLYSLAYHDQLTGAPNRQRLREDFDALAESLENGTAQGLFVIFDLDNFKNVNDSYGHNTGDIMLRRVVDYLESVPDLAGKIYRLGGDEFVLLYHHENRGQSPDEIRAVYSGLMEKALRSYTLANIEVSCTLSMGAALFPAHGSSFSELLRKADIALYRAKANGRNQYVFFEDRYDAAKKFRDLYVSLQPIFGGEGRVFGYELIDEGGDMDEDGVLLPQANRALDMLDLEKIKSNEKYFIAYTPHMLAQGSGVRALGDKYVVVFHMPERITEDDLTLYRSLRRARFNLALFGLRESNAIEPVFEIAQIFRFAADGIGVAERRRILRAHGDKLFIEQNVHTTEVKHPSLDKQQNIIQFLDFLSSKIATEQNLLSAYQKQKKYLLQQMFI